ncbi:MAG TPA: hypothetical protein VGF32_00340, partial [Streptosporangiaceae bacterium]
MRGALIALAAAAAVAFAILTSWTAALIIAAVIIFLTAPFFFLARVLAAAIVAAFVLEGALFVWANPLILAAAVAAVLARPVFSVARLASVPASARRFYGPMLWAAWRWRWLCRNLNLGYVDRHHRRLLRPRVPGTTAVRVEAEPLHVMRWPRAYHWRVDRHGWSFRVRTVPRTGRAEVAKAAHQIADAHRAYRVSVAQLRPGVLEVRSLRVDPLAQPYPLELAPAAPYALDPMAPRPWTWHLGRDEWGRERSVPLAQLPAFTVAGMPGFGKTVLASGLLYQFTPSPLVRVLLLADGKGGSDYVVWDGRAERITGEDLAETTDALAEVHAELVRRLAAVMPELGVRNAWRIGPSRSWPLGLTLLDEIHTFTDLDLYKGDRDAEKLVRHCRRFVSELVRKGRSVMMLTGCLDQHMTTDALPSGIRDAAPLALSFATKTTA